METNRLKIRTLNEGDAPFLFQLMNTLKWHQYIGDKGIANVQDARKYIRSKMSTDLDEKGFINHLMIEKASNRPVGTCSIHDRDGVEGLDVGYAMLEEFEGLGYATEGATLMVQMAFTRFKSNQLSAITSIQNRDSQKVLEKIGFRYQSNIMLPDGKEEIRLFVIERTDFEGNLRRSEIHKP